MDRNPFTQVYDALERVLKARDFKLVSWNSSRDPEPDVRSESDLPEFQLRPTAMAVSVGNRSCGTQVERTYTVYIVTGDDRLGYQLFPAEWKLLAALRDMKYGALDSLSYNNRAFVENVEIVSCTADLDLAAERGIEGWAALWDINVQMSFSDEDIV